MPTPTIVSGYGGKITKGAVDLAVASWKLRKASRLGDATHSLTGGSEYRKKIVRGGMLTAEVMWDSTNTPETTGIDDGDEFNATLNLGDSALKYTGVPFISESLELIGCDMNGVVRYTLTAYAQ